MSDRKRDKNSKSTYMRAARKQRMIENQSCMKLRRSKKAQNSRSTASDRVSARRGMTKCKEGDASRG